MKWNVLRDGYNTLYNGTVLGVHFDPPVQQWIVSVNGKIVEGYFFDSLGEAQKFIVKRAEE